MLYTDENRNDYNKVSVSNGEEGNKIKVILRIL